MIRGYTRLVTFIVHYVICTGVYGENSVDATQDTFLLSIHFFIDQLLILIRKACGRIFSFNSEFLALQLLQMQHLNQNHCKVVCSLAYHLSRHLLRYRRAGQEFCTSQLWGNNSQKFSLLVEGLWPYPLNFAKLLSFDLTFSLTRRVSPTAVTYLSEYCEVVWHLQKLLMISAPLSPSSLLSSSEGKHQR